MIQFKQKLFFRQSVFLDFAIGFALLVVFPAYSQAENSSKDASQLGPDSGFVTAIENVAKNVGPTVVSIRTEKIQRYRTGFSFGSPYEDEFFNRFFEDFFGDQFEREYKSAGLGSGVIIDPKGYILTNEHVISEADKIMVRLSDGREAKGTLTGTDPRSDLAVIKIELPDLPSAKLGDSDHLKIGQWVVAIGNPFGHLLESPEPTVTTGVISALQRSLPRTSHRDTDYTDLIQTDAAINPGNSGGPLMDLQGQIVGINVAIFSTSGGYQGIGFAIPVNHANRIIGHLIKGEKVTYGWIGIGVQDFNRSLAEYFHLDKTEGVLVSGVMEAGPADKAGINDGDIILSINSVDVKNTSALLRTVGDFPIGKKIDVKVLRDGKSLSLPVTIGERPEFDDDGRMIFDQEENEDEQGDELPEENLKNWRGLSVRNFSPDMLTPEMKDVTAGVVIANIDDDSPAQETGLRKGDVIISINQSKIETVEDFYRVVKKVKGDCLLQTVRGYFVLKEK